MKSRKTRPQLIKWRSIDIGLVLLVVTNHQPKERAEEDHVHGLKSESTIVEGAPAVAAAVRVGHQDDTIATAGSERL